MVLCRVLLCLLVVLPVGAYAACAVPNGDAGHVIFNTTTKTMQYCNGTHWVNTGKSEPAASQTGCVTPAGVAGQVVYVSTTGVVQFCNGQNWVDTACAATRSPNGSGCGGKPAGTMQYNSTHNELQFCDSTDWVAMGWACPLETVPAVCYDFTTWTPRGISSAGWIRIASSADGMKWAAIDGSWMGNAGLYTSTDGGLTWTLRIQKIFNDVASSSDGMTLVGVQQGSKIDVSTDGGATWTARGSTGWWQNVTMSADGAKIAVAAYGGYIYVSTDRGVTWTSRGSNKYWLGIASSADGETIAAINDRVYLSKNGGVTWVATGPATTGPGVIAVSANGQIMATASSAGYISISTDGGATWSNRDVVRSWQKIAMSADGSKMAATVYNGQVYTSDDTGTTWTPRASNRAWRGIASSANGAKLAAVAEGDAIYMSTCP